MKKYEGFYQLIVYALLMPHVSPNNIHLEYEVLQGRADMVLLELRQVHEFKMLKGRQYDRNLVLQKQSVMVDFHLLRTVCS